MPRSALLDADKKSFAFVPLCGSGKERYGTGTIEEAALYAVFLDESRGFGPHKAYMLADDSMIERAKTFHNWCSLSEFVQHLPPATLELIADRVVIVQRNVLETRASQSPG